MQNGQVYLVAYIVGKEYANPAFFRLDRIKSFQLLGKSELSEEQLLSLRKQEKKDLYNMIAGNKLEVMIRIPISMRRILLDVFKSCVLVGSGYNDYQVYKIDTYKQEFLSWLLAQDKEVEILEPEWLKQEMVCRLKNILVRYEGGCD